MDIARANGLGEVLRRSAARFRDKTAIPWAVKREHRHDYAIIMLRREARRRAGMHLSPEDEYALEGWLRGVRRDGVVLHYDPDTAKGWSYEYPRPGIDTDLIRVPEVATSRRSAD